ncbi:MAG: PilZ domain-containing protein [Candidatus Koribacter versatilis]|uniref:PilZ domain-containing protein n=1 Tax=Candidatus Korobacter versatilis TaxID=658062 RepID=A0A932A7W2_9BACT|nr:PilZ domain-containing protein [Candidatus Koribacter versatilis]
MDGSASAPKQEMARRLPRHDTDNRVVLTVEKPDGAEKVRGRASNISEAGFGAVLAGELEIGTVAHAKLVLQLLAEPLEVTAQVKNRHGFSHGFAFVEITAEQRRIVMRYLRAASQEEAITAAEAMALTAEHVAEPHEVEPHEATGKFRFSPGAYAPKANANGGPEGTKNEDGGE